MRLSMIVAMTKERAIGYQNRLPWHLPKDLQHFKSITMGKPIIMGSKTHLSIGQPLPGRENIVLTRNQDAEYPGCSVYYDINQAIESLQSNNEEAFVIGGEMIYRALLPHVERLYVTEVDASVEADAFFPAVNWQDWDLLSEVVHAQDQKHHFNFRFLCYQRQR